MDEALMPAAPPTAQPRANATLPFNAEARKSMRMMHAKAIVSGKTGFELFSNACQRKRRLSTTPCSESSTPRKELAW
jgi:hypothetical protein